MRRPRLVDCPLILGILAKGYTQMSDEQDQSSTDDSTNEPPPGRDVNDEPTPKRQAELRAAYVANNMAGKPPYGGVVISTRGEVDWMVKERGWGTGGFESFEEAINFRSARFSAAALSHINFAHADLRDAVIANCTFSNANLVSSDLSGANIVNSTFDDADLTLADLSDIFITESPFNKADLSFANLSGAFINQGIFNNAIFTMADLSGARIGDTTFNDANFVGAKVCGAILVADFSGVDMTQTRMDSATMLGGARDADDAFLLNEKSRLLDVAWNGAILANVPWDKLTRLGDEDDIKAATSRIERVNALRDAARAYRGLAKALQAQGQTDPAIRYRKRELQLERRAQFRRFAFGSWIFSWLFNIVAGYGDRPKRAFFCYLTVVGFFTGVYWAITNQVFGFIQSHSVHLAWYEAIVLSISSFHGRGFFPNSLSLGDPIALVAAAEAVIGLFIELILVATFTQRLFAR